MSESASDTYKVVFEKNNSSGEFVELEIYDDDRDLVAFLKNKEASNEVVMAAIEGFREVTAISVHGNVKDQEGCKVCHLDDNPSREVIKKAVDRFSRKMVEENYSEIKRIDEWQYD